MDRASLDHQNDTFNIDNAMVYQILSKMFTDMDTCVYVKQRKATQDVQAVYCDIHKQFLGPYHVARQATDVEGKLKNSHYDDERKMWDWDKYVALHKKPHAIMESLTDYGYSGMDTAQKSATFSKASRALSWRQQ